MPKAISREGRPSNSGPPDRAGPSHAEGVVDTNCGFLLSDYFECFTKCKKLDFITLKCNRNKRYQKMDQVRKLIANHYDSYVIVRSPKEGIHWHAIASYSGVRPKLKLFKGTHFDVKTVGQRLPSRCNRKPRENPFDLDASVYTQIRHCTPLIKADKSKHDNVKPRSEHIATLLCYLFDNYLENQEFSPYENLSARL